MDKLQVIETVKKIGVVAVIRGNTPDEAVQISEACIAGGVTAIEVAFTTPRAHEAILTLSEKYKDNAQVVIGAGTVLDAETARMAILNGAAFVVSPAFDEATIKLCNRYRVACMPGTTTIQGVIQALELGADIVKVFPGEVVGSKFIKAVKGPLPQAQMMPTGGVSIDNVAEWFKAGAVAVGAGGALTGGGKSLTEITETAKKIVVAVAEARKKAR
ncbi:bifunctional 2-keto-4-hydroxyglutarate aldolase/2-keto-3-deoxy-6-phosphogluconate aldolase [Veillonella sp.]|uniref:bifunctional 2-keto-4-hydroxyglutarate aldolase/2-keto-3-deoxy-6-phosphogluconate aldolase n=2 Tax=Veillonella sp. TaxID=1926307 RepID=UPI0025F71F14|nr:bifunctional 2-keto-4-hydroxyglutarate aldolase/2-keto-3-deoxy-6-phosphogluconate aldolase [Veillonella sp.]